jgi:hypothetical protein
MQGHSVFRFATIVALVVTTLAGAFFTHVSVDAESHRHHIAAAERLSLEIKARIQEGLDAETDVYGLANGTPSFSRELFMPFGRRLLRRFGFSYVVWAPAVDAGKSGAFERQHGVKIAGSDATTDGVLLPVLFSAVSGSSKAAMVQPGFNLLSSPAIRPALVKSAQSTSPLSWGDVPVAGAPGLVLLQPMFGEGEQIAGWVVAGIPPAA